ncbi:hypothetical protein FRC03_006051 [Tulasnella sp. 419]|nr:hypothetical protein FRC03_006051 [Tulasnella sp. 419]
MIARCLHQRNLSLVVLGYAFRSIQLCWGVDRRCYINFRSTRMKNSSSWGLGATPMSCLHTFHQSQSPNTTHSSGAELDLPYRATHTLALRGEQEAVKYATSYEALWRFRLCTLVGSMMHKLKPMSLSQPVLILGSESYNSVHPSTI